MQDKMFPRQVDVYRHLMQTNGYRDYHVNYHYLVITKEKVPRLNVFDISLV